MALLNDRDRQSVHDMLAAMKAPVTLVFFTQTIGCEGCEVVKEIVSEVASLSDKITVDEVNFVLDKDKVATYGVERVPALAVVTDHDTGIRFYGAPSGYEFMSLLDAILLASGEPLQLSEASVALAQAVQTPTAIQVFVTPT
jgi:alkyl hydroperoxide reductase subunit AhpF